MPLMVVEGSDLYFYLDRSHCRSNYEFKTKGLYIYIYTWLGYIKVGLEAIVEKSSRTNTIRREVGGFPSA